jgi:hypothetical protein
MKKKYFSPYSKPLEPSKPSEKIVKNHIVQEVQDCNYEFIPIPEGATEVYVEYRFDIGLEGLLLKFQNPIEINNPNYEKQLKKYNKMYEQYKIELDEWEKLYKEYKQEERAKSLEGKKKLFEQLKNELGM